MLKDEKGSVLIELVASCLVMLIIFYACFETWLLVQDKLHLQKVARDGAREAVIVDGSLAAGEEKAKDRARQYFGSKAEDVQIELSYDTSNPNFVICRAGYRHPLFGLLSKGGTFGESEVDLHAKATFGWRDSG